MSQSGSKIPKTGTCFSCNSRTFSRFLLIACAAAFLLRMAVSVQLIRNDPAVTNPVRISDMFTYLELAKGILHGNFPEQFYYQPFYYAVLLPFCLLFGNSGYILAFVQACLGTATVYFSGLSALKIGGRRAGLWTLFLAAFLFLPVAFTPYALLELVQGFWISLLFYLTLKLWEHPDRKLSLSCGLILGLSVLTRGNSWCFLPVLILLLLYRTGIKRKTLFLVLLLLTGAVIPQIPFAVYNTVRTGHLCGPSTAGGAVLTFGNTPESAPAGLELPYPATQQEWLRTEKMYPIPLRILDWAKEEPLAFLEQQFQKFILFFDREEYENNLYIANFQKSSLLRILPLIPAWLMLIPAVAGFFLGCYRRFFLRRKKFLLLWGFLLLYALSITAFYILSRFRLPALGLFCVSAGVFLGYFFRRHNVTDWIRMFFFAALSLFLVTGFHALYAFAYEPVVASVLRPYGVQSILEKPPYPGLPEGRYLLIRDDSSFLRGGWQNAVSSGMTAVKLFRLKQPLSSRRAYCVLTLFGSRQNYTFEINGITHNLMTPEGLLHYLPVPVPVDASGGTVAVRLSLTEAGADGTLPMDLRRDYGRTELDGERAHGELCVHLLIPLNEKEMIK